VKLAEGAYYTETPRFVHTLSLF